MQIVIIIIGVVFFIGLFNSRMDRPSKTMLGLYAGYFFISLYLATLGIRGKYTPKAYTYVLLLISFFSFVIGFSLIKIRRGNDMFSKSLLIDMEAVSNNRWINIIAYACCIYVVSKLIIFSSSVALYASVGHMRTDFYEGTLYGREFPYVNLFLGDLFYFFIPLFSYLTITKRRFLWLVIGVFLFGYVVLSGGRFGFVFILLGIVLTGFIYNLSKIKPMKLLALLVVIGSVFFFILILMTNARKGIYEQGNDSMREGADATIGTIVSYTSGPVVAFDQIVHDPSYPNAIGGYKFGRLTFSSLDRLIDYLTTHIFNFSTEPALKDISFKQEHFLIIGSETEWNALYSASLFYYLDLDIIGCAIFPFFLGLLFRYFIKCLYKKPTFSMMVLVYFFFKAVMYSIMDYSFVLAFDIVLIGLMYYDWNERYSHRSGLFYPKPAVNKRIVK